MPRILSIVALAIAGGTSLIAQTGDNPKEGKYRYAISVDGCLRGTRMSRPAIESGPENLPAEVRSVDGFMIEGSKSLIAEIKRHKGHTDRIVGIVTAPPSLGQTIAKLTSRKVGPIRIGIGDARAQAAQTLLKLDATSIEHLRDGCGK
jgi:hypothetical protein